MISKSKNKPAIVFMIISVFLLFIVAYQVRQLVVNASNPFSITSAININFGVSLNKPHLEESIFNNSRGFPLAGVQIYQLNYDKNSIKTCLQEGDWTVINDKDNFISNQMEFTDKEASREFEVLNEKLKSGSTAEYYYQKKEQDELLLIRILDTNQVYIIQSIF